MGWGGIKEAWSVPPPPSKIFSKLVYKNAIKHQKGVPIHPPSQNLAKTSSTLPLEFQTVCIYVQYTHLSLLLLLDVHCDFYEIKHSVSQWKGKLLTPCFLIHYRYFMTRFSYSYTFRINSKHRFVEILQFCQTRQTWQTCDQLFYHLPNLQNVFESKAFKLHNLQTFAETLQAYQTWQTCIQLFYRLPMNSKYNIR